MESEQIDTTLTIQTDIGSAERVAAYLAKLDHDHSLLTETSNNAQTDRVRSILQREAEDISGKIYFYYGLAGAVRNNTFSIHPEYPVPSTDEATVPPHSYFCDGIQTKDDSLSRLSLILDLVMTPKQVGHLLERSNAIKALQEGRDLKFIAPVAQTK